MPSAFPKETNDETRLLWRTEHRHESAAAPVRCTVAFYRDTLRLAEIEELKPNIVFAFGTNRLWIDPTPEIEQPELWLQVQTDDLGGAADHLGQLRSPRADANRAAAGWVLGLLDIEPRRRRPSRQQEE
jgi:hypothetical protein